MSCFRAALHPPARVRRSWGDFELSAQNWGAKKLSLMPMPQQGLTGGEGWKSWYPALVMWQSASKVLLLPVGRVEVRGVSNIAVTGGWQAGLSLGWYPLKTCRLIPLEEMLSSRNKCSDESQVLDIWGNLGCHCSEARIEGVCLCEEISGYICTWNCFFWTSHVALWWQIFVVWISQSVFGSPSFAKVLEVLIMFPVAIVELISCSLEWWNQMLHTFLIEYSLWLKQEWMPTTN